MVIVVLALWVTSVIGLIFGLPYGQYFIGNHPWLAGIIYFQTFLLVGIPIMAIGFTLWSILQTKRTGVVKLKNKLWWIWIANIIILVSIVSFFVKDFATGSRIESTHEFKNLSDKIEIDFQEYYPQDAIIRIETPDFWMANGEFVMRNVKTYFVPGDSVISLKQINYARGNTNLEAEERAREISMNIEMEGSILKIPQYYTIRKGDLWRAQNVKFEIQVPVGQKISIPKSDKHYFSGINFSDCTIQDGYYSLEMFEDGFRCVK